MFTVYFASTFTAVMMLVESTLEIVVATAAGD